MPASILERSRSELTTLISRLLSWASIPKSLRCFSEVSPPTPSSNNPVPSLIEVSGVRSSWDIEAKKSAFIRSSSCNFSHIKSIAAANSLISGGDLTSTRPSKFPLAISRVLVFNNPMGRVILLVMKSDIKTIASRHAMVIVSETSRAWSAAAARSVTFV